MSEFEMNQDVAEQICKTNRWNGNEFETGAWVALLEGNVVATAKDLDGALSALRRRDSDPKHGMIFKVGPQAIDSIR
jgi:hypothetical protein